MLESRGFEGFYSYNSKCKAMFSKILNHNFECIVNIISRVLVPDENFPALKQNVALI